MPLSHSGVSLHDDLHHKVFEQTPEIGRAWIIPIMYWRTHNPITPSIILDTEGGVRAADDGSYEQIAAHFTLEPDADTQHPCWAYAHNAQGIRDTVKIVNRKGTLHKPQENNTNPNSEIEQAARDLWSKNFNRNLTLHHKDTTVELNCSSWNNSNPNYTVELDLKDFGNTTDLIRHLFTLADERRHG